MHTRTIPAALAALTCIATGMVSQAPAETFPSRPVRVIVPFPASGSVDVVMRMFNAKLSELMGQTVVIDDRPGAAGNIGTELVAHSVPDGHTLLATSLPLVVNPALLGNLPYGVFRDFAPVSLVAAEPFVLAVHPALPVSTVRELIAYVRVRPGELNYASVGNGTSPHMAAELFKNLARVDIVHVPYKARGPAFAALLSGETQLGFIGVVAMVQLVRSGRLHALGVSSTRRSPALPEVPTIAESGLPGYEFTSWYGVLAPRKTPAERVVALNGHIHNALRAPEMAERFSRDGANIIASTPEEFARHLRLELAKWAKVVKEAGLKAE